MAMNVLVLMGGGSAEREISLKTGAGIVEALRERGHHVLAGDPATGRLGSGDPRLELAGPSAGSSGPRAPLSVLADLTETLVNADKEAARIDVVLVALHGGMGEDGTLQTLLELAGRTYTGSGPLASGLAMNKVLAKRLFVWAGVPTPEWLDLAADDARALAREVIASAPGSALAAPARLAHLGGPPIVVKPTSQGSTIGLTIVESWPELPEAVELAAGFDESVLFERYVPGRELAVGILGDQALPVVEIEPTKGVYDYECKYTSGMSRYTCPARLPEEVTRRVHLVALTAFETLGCADFGRVDIRLAPDQQPYVLEVNTIPGMTATSLLPMAASAVGISYEELVERMCELAMTRRGRSGPAPGRPPVTDSPLEAGRQ